MTSERKRGFVQFVCGLCESQPVWDLGRSHGTPVGIREYRGRRGNGTAPALIRRTCVRRHKEKSPRETIEIETSSRSPFPSITNAILSLRGKGELFVPPFLRRHTCYLPLYAHFAIAVKRTRH